MSVLVYLLYDVTIYIHKVSVLVYFYYVSKRSVLVHLLYGFTIEGTFENFMRTPTVGCIFFLRSLHFCLCANFYAHPDSGLRSELSKTLLSAFEVSLRLESKALATTFTYTLKSKQSVCIYTYCQASSVGLGELALGIKGVGHNLYICICIYMCIYMCVCVCVCVTYIYYINIPWGSR